MFVKFNLDKILTGTSFFEENQRKINKIVCKSMTYAFLAFPIMLILNAMGIFKFSGQLVVILMLLGGFCTLSPFIISKFVHNQLFIQYYSLICIIILISYLGTQYYVGIYMTFILASILSCLYFDKKFTVIIVALSYIGFLISYYFRATEIRNHLYPTETVLENYIPLVIGYTIEFGVSLLFLYKVVDRAHIMMVEQELMIAEMAKGEVKTNLALAATKDILFEYDIEKDCFSSNGTIRGWGHKEILIDNFKAYVERVNWTTDELARAMRKYITVPEEMGNHFQEEICLSFTENGKDYPIWSYFELNVLRNSEGEPETIIGKMRDITQLKLENIKAEEAKKCDTLSGMYNYASMHKIVKEMAGQYEDVFHQIMIIHIKNIQEIIMCYGRVYCDFVLMNVAEVIKKAIEDDGILTCRLSENVFLVYIADSDSVNDKKIRQSLSTGLGDLYVGEKEVAKLEYDFGYYIGEEEIDDLVTMALRYVGADKLPGMDAEQRSEETLQGDDMLVGNEQIFSQLLDTERSSVCENFLENIAALLAGTEDRQSAMQMALTRIGRFFELSGIRIYEFPDTMRPVLAAFSWAINEQIERESNEFVLSCEVRNFFAENFGRSRLVDNTTGAFQDFFRQFGENPLHMNRYSSLICPVMLDGKCKGVILYDMAEAGYTWSDEKKELLLETSKVAGNVLLAYFADSLEKNRNVFLSNLSYEVRSPINAIMGMTEIARGQINSAEQMGNCLDSIDISSKKLISIVNDVFDLSKMEFGTMKLAKDVFSLEDMMAQIENQMIFESDKKGIEFILERKFEENLLYGDAPRIFQVVSYLIENALRYTRRGGSVRAMIKEISNSGEDVTLFFEIHGNDDGIRLERKEKMFVAFDQDDSGQKAKHGDTGLDLAVCYHLVQIMGANLEVKSEPGQGTTFYFTLQVEIPAREEKLHFISEQEGQKKGTVDLSGKKVLLAEDNGVSAEIVKRLLERQGAVVLLAENGMTCVEKFCQSEVGEIALILMDINMPKMNGHEATREIRLLDRKDALKVPIIAMTANAFEEDMEQSMAAGMDAHLAKPVQLKSLLEEVGNVLERKSL